MQLYYIKWLITLTSEPQFEKIPFSKNYLIKILGYFYNSVIVITFELAKDDHIKQHLQNLRNTDIQ